MFQKLFINIITINGSFNVLASVL